MKKNKKIIIISVIGLLVITGAAAVTYKLLRTDPDPSNTVPPDSNYVTDKNQPLTNGTTPSEDKVITPAPSTPSDTGTPPEKPSLTRAEQSGSNIRVSAVFTAASSGNCLLTLQKSGYASVTKTAAIIVGPSYYTCNGFLVPRSELPVGGEWTATVTHQANGKSTASDAKVITVQ